MSSTNEHAEMVYAHKDPDFTLPPSAEDVEIRPATEDDRDFVREQMTRYLASHYDGDHISHADRLLDSNLRGFDAVGHFSLSQLLCVVQVSLDSGWRRVGILNLVRKRQGTVKISPLILISEYQNRGIASRVLSFVEDYARSVQARQLYLTASETNKAALSTACRLGFVIAGAADAQYTSNTKELMLYKNLRGDVAPNLVTAIRAYRDGDYRYVREIIMNEIAPHFYGVNDDWIAAMIDGYRRSRLSMNVNQKIKLIYVVVDSQDQVSGVVSAGPKKGGSIKIMPLAGTSAALDVILSEIPSLFSPFGHKLYCHIPPQPSVVAALQRHKWTIDAVFAHAYHPETCTLQWSLNIEGNW
jgi:GNAT superfamily N-acetyltransferase